MKTKDKKDKPSLDAALLVRIQALYRDVLDLDT